MVGYAIWVVKHPQYLHEANESSVQPFLETFVIVYLNDILIYSRSEQEHLDHLTRVMVVLDHEKLFGDLKKCMFFIQEVTFLGYIVSTQGSEVDKSKIEAI